MFALNSNSQNNTPAPAVAGVPALTDHDRR